MFAKLASGSSNAFLKKLPPSVQSPSSAAFYKIIFDHFECRFRTSGTMAMAEVSGQTYVLYMQPDGTLSFGTASEDHTVLLLRPQGGGELDGRPVNIVYEEGWLRPSAYRIRDVVKGPKETEWSLRRKNVGAALNAFMTNACALDSAETLRQGELDLKNPVLQERLRALAIGSPSASAAAASAVPPPPPSDPTLIETMGDIWTEVSFKALYEVVQAAAEQSILESRLMGFDTRCDGTQVLYTDPDAEYLHECKNEILALYKQAIDQTAHKYANEVVEKEMGRIRFCIFQGVQAVKAETERALDSLETIATRDIFLAVQSLAAVQLHHQKHVTSLETWRAAEGTIGEAALNPHPMTSFASPRVELLSLAQTSKTECEAEQAKLFAACRAAFRAIYNSAMVACVDEYIMTMAQPALDARMIDKLTEKIAPLVEVVSAYRRQAARVEHLSLEMAGIIAKAKDSFAVVAERAGKAADEDATWRLEAVQSKVGNLTKWESTLSECTLRWGVEYTGHSPAFNAASLKVVECSAVYDAAQSCALDDAQRLSKYSRACVVVRETAPVLESSISAREELFGQIQKVAAAIQKVAAAIEKAVASPNSSA